MRGSSHETRLLGRLRACGRLPTTRSASALRRGRLLRQPAAAEGALSVVRLVASRRRLRPLLLRNRRQSATTAQRVSQQARLRASSASLLRRRDAPGGCAAAPHAFAAAACLRVAGLILPHSRDRYMTEDAAARLCDAFSVAFWSTAVRRPAQPPSSSVDELPLSCPQHAAAMRTPHASGQRRARRALRRRGAGAAACALRPHPRTADSQDAHAAVRSRCDAGIADGAGGGGHHAQACGRGERRRRLV